jgi:hypothetical protein
VPDPPPPSAPPTSPAPSNPWQPAIDGYRNTAKWIIGGFAGVGAALAGTSVLGSIGMLSWATDKQRLLLAGGAAAIGFLVVVAAVFIAASVLAPSTVTLSGLVRDPPGDFKILVEDDPFILQGVTQTLDEFHAEFMRRLAAVSENRAAVQKDPDDAVFRAALATSQKQLDALGSPIQSVINLGIAVTVREQFRFVRRAISLCAVLAGVSLVSFAWAANPSSSPNPSTTTQTVDATTVAGGTTTTTITTTTTTTITDAATAATTSP